MHGNVWQWCQDWAVDYPQNDVVDPQGPEKGQERVLRGGRGAFYHGQCRSAQRGWVRPGYRNDGIGFRLCFSLEEDGILAPKKDPPKKEEAAVPPNPFTNSIGHEVRLDTARELHDGQSQGRKSKGKLGGTMKPSTRSR